MPERITVTMHSGELRDCWKRLQIARETAEDVAVLIGPSDRDQAARLMKIVERIDAEIGLLAQKTDAARKAEKGE
jgi:hypothetical protein